MNILIVEDDENKRSQIIAHIAEAFPLVDVSVARSFHSGLRAIVEGGVDVIILDMTMPTFDITADDYGGRPQAYAGRDVLRQMDRRGIETPCIVLTQFDRFGEGPDTLTLAELDAQLAEAHPRFYRGAVYYDVSVEGWKDALADKISSIFA